MAIPLRTKRGHEYFVENGFKYIHDRNSANGFTRFWRCEFKDTCRARIHTQSGIVMKRLNEHNHESNPAAIEVTRIHNIIKRRAIESQDLPSQLISSAISGASQAVRGQLPKNSIMSKIIRRARNEANQAPSDPQSRSELVIPESYQLYDGKPFLLIDTGIDDRNRILVFGRQSHEEWANQIENLYMDGTFKICPSIFSQMFQILARRGTFVVPIFYALLPNKHRGTYDHLFRLIKELRPQMNPVSVATDFELAEFNAIRDAWPTCQIHGCFFHLNQSMHRQVGQLGHKALYDNNATFKLWCKAIIALAFVPVQRLDGAFNALTEAFPDKFQEELQSVADWFEDNYLGREHRGHRRRPLFPPEIWNLYERVLTGSDRTNNFSEAAHKRNQKQLCIDHPTIWRFIDGLRAVQVNRDKEYEEFVRGSNGPQKRRKYQKADKRIQVIVEGGFGEDGERTIIEYLCGLAHNFNMDV